MIEKNIRERSGSVDTEDRLVVFLYVLIRDHVHPGDLEQVILNFPAGGKFELSNGWLGLYAKDIADRLTNGNG